MAMIKRRASKPKVRTGCITCKVRHVKCDEGKPSCHKCSATGRNCDGYELTRSLVKYQSHSRGSISSQTISFDIQGNEQERRGFSFFRSRTAVEIVGFFPSYFWETLILQASHADPVILHAVVALGSLHEIYQKTEPGSQETSEAYEKRQFALKQSNKAIRLLRTHISTAPRSGETVLMACVLFICLEIFQGNFEAALMHLDSGMKVLGSWLRDERSFCRGMTVSRPSRTFIESSLIPVFARLDIQASTDFGSRPLHCEIVLKDLDISKTPPMPAAFSSVTEASDSLVGLVYHMFHLQQVAHDLLNPTGAGSPYKSPEGLVVMFMTARQENRAQLDLWLAALNSLLQNSSSNLSLRDLRGCILLKVQYLFVAIMLGASGANDETMFDNYTADFRQMIKLVESLLVPSTLTEQPGQKPSYLFDTQIIPPLYIAVCRCRHPELRRRALYLLLKLKSREGIWDSEQVAAVGKWVIEKEEEGLEIIDGPYSIPIESRISLFGRGTIRGGRRCVVKYRRGALVPGKDQTEEQYLTW